MTVRCKSLLKVQETAENFRYGAGGARPMAYTLRTTYDMGSVRDHEIDLKVWWTGAHLGQALAWLIPIIIIVSMCLGGLGLIVGFCAAVATGGNFVDPLLKWLTSPTGLVVMGLLVLGLSVFISLSLTASLAEETVLREAVLRERGLGPDAPLHVVRDYLWPGFEASLRS